MAKPSTSFQSKLTQAEKDAVVRAVIVDGMSSREAAAKAQAGELDGVGKIDITDSYVRKLATRARADTGPARLQQPGEADKAIDQARSRLLSYILHEQRRWETEAKAGNVDLPKAGRIMRALADYDRTQRGEAKRETGQDNDPPTETHETADALVARLLERSNGTSNGRATEAATAASLPSQRSEASGGHSA